MIILCTWTLRVRAGSEGFGACRGPDKSTQAKIRIGISHISPL